MIKIKKIGKENKTYWPESDIEIKKKQLPYEVFLSWIQTC